MVRSLVFLALVSTAAPAAAWAEGEYAVRNTTARAYTCGLRREDRSIIDRFVLQAGEEWRQTARDEGERVLLCDSWVVTPRWRMRSGVRYELVEEPRTGRVVLLSR
jgi:hypothetical protein